MAFSININSGFKKSNQSRFVFNGKEYTSLAQLQADLPEKYQKYLDDKNNNGIPDYLEKFLSGTIADKFLNSAKITMLGQEIDLGTQAKKLASSDVLDSTVLKDPSSPDVQLPKTDLSSAFFFLLKIGVIVFAAMYLYNNYVAS